MKKFVFAVVLLFSLPAQAFETYPLIMNVCKWMGAWSSPYDWGYSYPGNFRSHLQIEERTLEYSFEKHDDAVARCYPNYSFSISCSRKRESRDDHNNLTYAGTSKRTFNMKYRDPYSSEENTASFYYEHARTRVQSSYEKRLIGLTNETVSDIKMGPIDQYYLDAIVDGHAVKIPSQFDLWISYSGEEYVFDYVNGVLTNSTYSPVPNKVAKLSIKRVLDPTLVSQDYKTDMRIACEYEEFTQEW